MNGSATAASSATDVAGVDCVVVMAAEFTAIAHNLPAGSLR